MINDSVGCNTVILVVLIVSFFFTFDFDIHFYSIYCIVLFEKKFWTGGGSCSIAKEIWVGEGVLAK